MDSRTFSYILDFPHMRPLYVFSLELRFHIHLCNYFIIMEAVTSAATAGNNQEARGCCCLPLPPQLLLKHRR